MIDGITKPEPNHPAPAWPGARGTLSAMLVCALMTGCATTHSADVGDTNADPLESVNRPVYTVNDFLDRTIGKPVATSYIKYTPRPIRNGVSNFFDNVTYPNSILNSFLQGKPRRGFRSAVRFLVNSTFGLLGVWDMATPLGLESHIEDFGQTLNVWGVDEGAYLVLPFIGPNSIRDAPDLGVGAVTNILFYVSNPFVVPVAILGFVDKRARVDEAVNLRDRAAVEPYLFTREAYRQHRTFQAHDGNPPIEDDGLLDDALIDDVLIDDTLADGVILDNTLTDDAILDPESANAPAPREKPATP